AVLYLPETDTRMLPTYERMRKTFDKAFALVSAPFERVQIPYEGQTLEGFFYAARGGGGRKAPVVFNYSGADGILGGRAGGGASEFRARGISYLDVDGPGQGGSLRVKQIYAPPDSERYARAVVDYLVGRPDVDADRIAINGSSMAGYSAPRSASVEKRFKA